MAFVSIRKDTDVFVGSGSSTRKRIMMTNIRKCHFKLYLGFIRIFPRRGHLGRATDQLCIVVQAVLGMVDLRLSLFSGFLLCGTGGG
jgi:hypothetical protein